MTKRGSRPVSLYVLMAALLIQGISGIAGGYGLVDDPTGDELGIPVTWLQGSPFNDYLVPGLILLFVLGLLPLVVAHGLWVGGRWAWPAALAVGSALIGWITIQILIIGYQAQPPLQLSYGLLGIAIVVLALLPSVRARKHVQHVG